MIWEKKSQPQPNAQKSQPIAPKPAEVSPPRPVPPKPEVPIVESTPRLTTMPVSQENHTVFGHSVSLKGELSASEDLLIDGQFEGNISLPEHCLTIGPQGEVKADIQARQVIVQGTVSGKVTARDRFELKKSGRMTGDVTGAGIAIEDGAYFKGSIDIVRQDGQPQRPQYSSASKSTSSD